MKCAMCKNEFLPEELQTHKKLHYCAVCYKEKLQNEMFAAAICEIFDIKAPGPKIYSQRKRLQDQYGYTDEQIIRCLRYLFDIRHCDPSIQSLGLVTPRNIAEADADYRAKQYRATMIQKAATETKIIEHKLQTPSEYESRKTIHTSSVDWDDLLNGGDDE